MKKLTKTAQRVIYGTAHRNLGEAIASDVVDVIPIAGDIGNAMRVYKLAKEGKDTTALTLQTGDLLIGAIPVIGAVGDLVTPTNTLLFILRKTKLKKKLRSKLPKIPKFKYFKS